MCFPGLDQITAEKNSPAPSKQRKEAPESQRIKPKSQDEDYQPDLASGYYLLNIK